MENFAANCYISEVGRAETTNMLERLFSLFRTIDHEFVESAKIRIMELRPLVFFWRIDRCDYELLNASEKRLEVLRGEITSREMTKADRNEWNDLLETIHREADKIPEHKTEYTALIHYPIKRD